MTSQTAANRAQGAEIDAFKDSATTFWMRVLDDSMDTPEKPNPPTIVEWRRRPRYPRGAWAHIECVVRQHSDPDQVNAVGASEAGGGIDIGDFVVARVGDRVVFRQFALNEYGRFLDALNPSYPPIKAPFEVIGKVIGCFTAN